MEPVANKQAEDQLMLEWMHLFEKLPQESMTAYVERYLGGLLAMKPDRACDKPTLKERNERRQREELLLTLETLIACDGQINELAAKMFIHRNTAAYRIEKLEKLLGMPLKQTESLLRLKLAFIFKTMLR